MINTTFPALFVAHGAPTMVLDPGAAGAAQVRAAADLPRPRAIVVVSAHWQSAAPTVGVAPELDTMHDFHGFPPALYDVRYPARSDPAVAEQLRHLLRDDGFDVHVDRSRGLDHGAWTPLCLMYPAADIPLVPLSLLGDSGPEEHFRIGRALAPLLADGVLLLASGNITHNLADWRHSPAASGQESLYAGEFAEWMAQRIAAGDRAALVDYRRQAPHAARAHPSEEHLLPLFVALAAAGDGYRPHRLYAGIEAGVLAMDSYAFWPATGDGQ
ncbi:MAG: dioxygenase [Candidatus Accumulibacter sp.]|uniref:DODA-type extradiol aromatic ring-opening family dioxygenase n=1 Tax=Accumulibacter sp. TaxID=2053492 RepID=UPI0019F81856|nr:class III extradiol ring-cleavage dioxygenase [Accumulibacter sp.]MBE2259795.1 dioxygenase [Paracoccaceae bacterium]MCP5248464.1 dioxygenase [Accumulibacter sp.]